MHCKDPHGKYEHEERQEKIHNNKITQSGHLRLTRGFPKENETEGPGTVAHTCNPRCCEAEAGGSPKVRSLKPAWSTWWNPVSTKNTKISQARCHMPIIPATQEAEAGKFLEPRRWRLQWAKIMPLHSSLGDKSEIPFQKQNKKNRVTFILGWI